MDEDFKNPFAGYGVIVNGDRFIGRKDDLGVVENRIIRPKESGNLAIIGEPKIGKSSLIYKSIMDRKYELITKRILPIWINFGTYEQIPQFFFSLVTYCLDGMEKLNLLDEPIKHSAQFVLEDIQSRRMKYYNIQRFFEKVRQADYRVLFILDEFDHARNLFKGDISGFQKLRELSYFPDWRVTFITTSRRTIREIEMQSHAISSFYNIFHEHYLTGFNDEDINQYYKTFSSIDLSVTSENKNKISFHCGGHPYLLDVLGYEIVELFREKQTTDVDKAAHRTEQSFINYYDHMLEHLVEDGSLNKLLQILFGPVVDVRQNDVDKLLRLGVIKSDNQGCFVGFSEKFQIFLNLVQRDADLWPVWSKTERLLRHVIETTMMHHYGEPWITKLENSHQNLKVIFDNCREAQKKEEKSFGSRCSLCLIDYTYPQDLFAIIFAEWSIFRPLFGKDKNYWDQHKQLLAKIRNPLAHNRSDSLLDYEQQIAEGYCKEILGLLANEGGISSLNSSLSSSG